MATDSFHPGYEDEPGENYPSDNPVYDNDYSVTNSTNSTNGTSGSEYYSDYYGYDDYYETFSTFHHKVYPFEEIIYLYIWPIMVIVTTLTNVLVVLVLVRKNMRTSTNIILIAIAISDTLTGLVTLPAYIHAYRQRVGDQLNLTRFWCQYFMLTKLFLTRAFHTVSVWLTLALGFQRLISVISPFKANSMFSTKKTLVIIVLVFICSPILHVYQLTEEKTSEDDGGCGWQLSEPCGGACIYIWITFYLAHFIPCILLVSFTVGMVMKLCKTTKKMINANMISNEANIRRRSKENRRISLIVIVIVILFLVPEIPYSIFLVLNVSLKHAKKDILHVKSNRAFMCTYEILMVASFHANFWVYLIMNRKFRHGLATLFPKPVSDSIMTALKRKDSTTQSSRRQSVTSGVRTLYSDAPNNRGPSSDDMSPNALEMKTYNFDQNGGNVVVSY